jgi:hypothetical protein
MCELGTHIIKDWDSFVKYWNMIFITNHNILFKKNEAYL